MRQIIRLAVIIAILVTLVFVALLTSVERWDRAFAAEGFTCSFAGKRPMAFSWSQGNAVHRGKAWATIDDRFRMFYRGDTAIVADKVVKIDGRLRSASAGLIVKGKQVATGSCTMDTQADGRGTPI